MIWDYKKGDDIPFFDARQSYELTHYIPINETSGLNFDPKWFRQDAIKKEKTGKYCDAIRGTEEYNIFWKERIKRFKEGYESHGYRITGDNYFFINYYELDLLQEGTQTGTGRDRGLPEFLVFQYEYFHYLEMCEILNKDVCTIKSRSVGWSEIGASVMANRFSTRPNYRCLVTAALDGHMDGIRSMVWKELTYLNEETQEALKHLCQVHNTNDFKRATYLDNEGKEKGWWSEIEFKVSEDPNKLRSDRCDVIVLEESGSNKRLKEGKIKADALTSIRGRKMGTIIMQGTGGDSGDTMANFKDIVSDPEKYNILPVTHNYTDSGEDIISAMFVPVWRNCKKEQLDKRGFVTMEIGMKD